MKLHLFPPAPNPRKVLLYLAEKGLDVPRQRVNLLQGEQNSPAFLARNPRGAVPVLELDDGSHLIESLAIIEYLEELHPEPPMWGRTPEERAHARTRERICDLGVLIPIARCVHATKSPLGLPPSPEIATQMRETYGKNLRLLDTLMGDAPFLAGDRVTVADCTLAAAFGFGAAFGVEPLGEVDVMRVARWYARFSQRESLAG